jgi:hypothetical protein
LCIEHPLAARPPTGRVPSVLRGEQIIDRETAESDNGPGGAAIARTATAASPDRANVTNVQISISMVQPCASTAFDQSVIVQPAMV